MHNQYSISHSDTLGVVQKPGYYCDWFGSFSRCPVYIQQARHVFCLQFPENPTEGLVYQKIQGIVYTFVFGFIVLVTVTYNWYMIHEKGSSFHGAIDCVQGNDRHIRLLCFEKLSLTPLSLGI